MARIVEGHGRRIKVFWFFSSEKNILDPYEEGNNHMRKVLFACLLAASFHASAQSVPPERLQAALDVQRAMGGAAAVDQTFKAMRPALINLMTSQNHMPIGRAAELVDTVLLPALQAHSGELLAARAQSMARHFTVAELSDIKQFYLSPVGQKLLANQAVLGTEYMQALQPLMRDVMARTMTMMKSKAQPAGSPP
jgi:hypothetical protein